MLFINSKGTYPSIDHHKICKGRGCEVNNLSFKYKLLIATLDMRLLVERENDSLDFMFDIFEFA